MFLPPLKQFDNVPCVGMKRSHTGNEVFPRWEHIVPLLGMFLALQAKFCRICNSTASNKCICNALFSYILGGR